MSSLGAVQADGYYFHPDYVKGSLSKFNGSKGANQYEQRGVIRFEFPFDGWCLSCDARHSKGSRFNAKKEKDGKYLSTTVWRFTMKCTACVQQFVIKTDPKNATYDYFEGLRQRDALDPDLAANDNHLVISNLTDEDGGRALVAVDPMARLQRDQTNKCRARTKEEQLQQLEDFQERSYHDADANSVLRQAAREARTKSRLLLLEGYDRGLSMALVEAVHEDAEQAKRMMMERVVVRPQRAGGLGSILSEPMTFKRPLILSEPTTFKRPLNPSQGGDAEKKRRRHGGSGSGRSSTSSSSSSRDRHHAIAAATSASPLPVATNIATSVATKPPSSLALLAQYDDDD